MRGEARGQLDGHWVRVGPNGEVRHLLGLFAGRLGEFDTAMSDLDGEQPGETVEVTVALVVPDVAAIATLHDPHRVNSAADRGEVHPQVAVAELGEFFMVHDGSLGWLEN